MELVYDDKTGTWGEAPEVYGTIECATKEDYEYAKKAIKGYKELEAKHWDECRQIAHYDDELKEAKRLLKSAANVLNMFIPCDEDYNCRECIKYRQKCDYDDSFKWRYLDEALKLIGGNENG